MMMIDGLQVLHDVTNALREDIGSGDVSQCVVDPSWICTAYIVTRETCVVAGIPWFEATLYALDSGAEIIWHVSDGQAVNAETRFCDVKMHAQALLAAERTGLNFLQCLSATATKTAAYVAALPPDCKLLDTRKTLPGLRAAQKYAVRCGGGYNHRMGLYDAILLKENHLMAAGGIEAAIINVKHTHPGLPIEIEVETLSQCEQAMAAGADRILLDNFSPSQVPLAVSLRGERKIALELSGNIQLNTLSSLNLQGVDYVSVGDLTKNIQAVDLSLRLHENDSKY